MHKDPYLPLSCFSQVLVCVVQNGSFGENSKSHHFSHNRIQVKTKFTVNYRVQRERERTQSWWVRDGKEGNKVGGFPFHLLGLFFWDRGCVSGCRRMREREKQIRIFLV